MCHYVIADKKVTVEKNLVKLTWIIAKTNVNSNVFTEFPFVHTRK